MSLSSGAYFGSHSGVSQCSRSASAARVALLVWTGPLMDSIQNHRDLERVPIKWNHLID
jgi:hypothetical protein